MIKAIIAILGGAIAASQLIIEKWPSSAKFLKSISEYKGVFGVILTIWGILGIFRVLRGGIFGNTMDLILSASEFIVGFLLAYELIQQHLLKNSERATEIGEDMKTGLAKYQVPAGIVLIVLGVISLF